MCEIYVKADPALYESRSRSVRIHGVVTSIRLEALFWDVLAEIAASDGMTTSQLIAKLHDEIVEYRGEVPNLASFLRVSCLRYLTLVRRPADDRRTQSAGTVRAETKKGRRGSSGAGPFTLA